jgi:uncharacterized repeat protein (TIGR02543 family)
MTKGLLAIYLVLVVLVAGLIPGCTGGGGYNLTIAVAPTGGGTATDETGTSPYAQGAVVDIEAVAAAGYEFVNWSAPAGTFADANAAITTFTMPPQDVTITANFVLVYNLTISSTAGGAVTDPGEGTFPYDAGTEVDLVATPDADYHFVNWTGDVGTVDDVNAATTTITMNGDYSITANFGFDMAFIDEVPDTNQPPTQTLNTTIPNNFCAPMAVTNILEYWDDVMSDVNAQDVTAGLIPETVAEYVGYFMDTNNTGSPDRVNNAGSPGTHNLDIMPGIIDFVRWDATHPLPIIPDLNAPTLPLGKLGYNWGVIHTCDTDYSITLNLYKNEIDSGRPLVVSFDYWNPTSKASYPDPETGETIDVFIWGDYTTDSLYPNPQEHWTSGDIGHAVTGVGYKLAWDPDGAGPIPSADWVIVHDNWATTSENVAIPWANWMCLWLVQPSP